MAKYNVHVYAIVRVLVSDVEAENHVEAMKKAERRANLDSLFSGRNTEYADELDGFLVDEEGDVEHERSTWYEKDYTPSPSERR